MSLLQETLSCSITTTRGTVPTAEHGRPVKVPVATDASDSALPRCHPVLLLSQASYEPPSQGGAPWRQKPLVHLIRLTPRFPLALDGRVGRGLVLKERGLGLGHMEVQVCCCWPVDHCAAGMMLMTVILLLDAFSSQATPSITSPTTGTSCSRKKL